MFICMTFLALYIACVAIVSSAGIGITSFKAPACSKVEKMDRPTINIAGF
jgi:hypothetical protein